MRTNHKNNWKLLFSSGVVMLLLALITFTQSSNSILNLGQIFGAAFTVMGVFEIGFSIGMKKVSDKWDWNLMIALTTLIIGIILLENSNISIHTLPFYVGYLYIIRSAAVFGIAYDVKLLKMKNWWKYMIPASATIAISIFSIISIELTKAEQITLMGTSTILMAGLSMYYSVRLNEIQRNWDESPHNLFNFYKRSKEKLLEEYLSGIEYPKNELKHKELD